MNEFYMKYPLRGQSMSVLGSAFDEMEFLSLHDSSPMTCNKNIRKLNSLSYYKPVRSLGIDIKLTNTTEESKFFQGIEDESADLKTDPENPKSFFSSSSNEGKNSSLNKLSEEEGKGLKSQYVYFCYGNEVIITVVESPYLTTKVVVRDITGKHAWIITEHRAMDCNGIDMIDLNDKAVVYKNILDNKGDQKFLDLYSSKITIQDFEKERNKEFEAKIEEALKPQPLKDRLKIEEEVKKSIENEVLDKILKILCDHFPDMKKVFI